NRAAGEDRMNRHQTTLLTTALVLMGAVAGLLIKLHAHQKLGPPAVKTTAIAGSSSLQVNLPERVLDYDSEPQPIAQIVLDILPKDTSFGQRLYTAPDTFWTLV